MGEKETMQAGGRMVDQELHRPPVGMTSADVPVGHLGTTSQFEEGGKNDGKAAAKEVPADKPHGPNAVNVKLA